MSWQWGYAMRRAFGSIFIQLGNFLTLPYAILLQLFLETCELKYLRHPKVQPPRTPLGSVRRRASGSDLGFVSLLAFLRLPHFFAVALTQRTRSEGPRPSTFQDSSRCHRSPRPGTGKRWMFCQTSPPRHDSFFGDVYSELASARRPIIAP